MFQFLSQALVGLTIELAKIPTRYEQSPIKFQRDVFVRLIDTYTALCSCEQALRIAHDELHKIAVYGTIPTKVVMRNKLTTLQHEVHVFGDVTIAAFALQRNQEAFLFSNCFIEVIGPKSFWLKPPRVIHLLSFTCPEMLTTNKKLSFTLRHPRMAPSNAMVDTFKYNTTEKSFEELKTGMLQEIQAQMQYSSLDIRDKAQLLLVIDNNEEHIAAVTTARLVLSDMIKTCFSLDKILS